MVWPAKATAQCQPTLVADSMQYMTDGDISCSAALGNAVYLGGSFTVAGKYTGSFIGIDTGSGQPLNRVAWPKINGPVNKVVSDGSGGWIIGGQFSRAGDSVRNNLVQINAAGAVTAWNPNANGPVNGLLQQNAKIYAVGAFTNIGGVTRNHAAAINVNTGLTTTWNPNVNDTAYEVQTCNGRIFIGGKFTTVGVATRKAVAAVDTNTGAVSGWNAAASNGAVIRSIAFKNNVVYVGGAFYSMGGQPRYSVAAVDSGTALATAWAPSPVGAVTKIVINDTTMYVGGQFSSISGHFRCGLAELSLAADTVMPFNPGVAQVSSSVRVNDILVVGNKMYVAGNFQLYSVYFMRKLRQVDIAADTVTSWESLGDDDANTINLQNGVLFAGGNFRMIGASARGGLAAIDVSADTLRAWNPGMGGAVYGLATGPACVYAGGNFYDIGGGTHPSLAALDTLTGLAVPGFNAVGSSNIFSLSYHAGKLYFSGIFNTINGVTRNSLAAVDGITGALLPWDPNGLFMGSLAWINKIETTDSNAYISGEFNGVGGIQRINVAAISLSTGAVQPLNPLFDSYTDVTLELSGNSLYIGGGFTMCNGVFAPRMAKVDLTTGNTSTTWMPYPNNSVTFIKAQHNFLYTAGSFTTIHALPEGGLAILDTTGSLPAMWNPAPSGTVKTISFSGNKMFVGGSINGMEGKSNLINLVQYTINTQGNSVQISGADTLCAGTAATFTAASTAAGATLQWRVNGVNAGTGATTFTYTPTNGDEVTCMSYAPAGACYSPDSAISNTLTVVVNPFVAISGQTTACAGSPIADTAFTASAGVTYQWHVNGANAGTGSIHTYIPANGDVITCTIHGITGCPGADSVVSAPAVVTVHPNLDVLTGLTVNNDTLCAGDTLHAHAHSAATGVHYSWTVNGTMTGTNDSLYQYLPANGDVVKCVATAPAGGCYITNPDSSSVTLTITPATEPLVAVAGDTVLCTGATGHYHIGILPAGATCQWYKNGTATGITTTTFTYVPANGDQLKCLVTLPLNGCYLNATDTSNTFTVLVNALVAPTIAVSTASTDVCAGSHATFFASAPGITGGSYQWKVNSANVGTSAPTYNYVPLAGDNVWCVLTTPAGGCFSTNTATSNTLVMSTTALTVPSVTVADPGPAALGTVVTLTATVANAGASYLITWYNNGVEFNTSTTPTTTYLKTAGTDNITAKISSTSAGCYDTTISASVAIPQAAAGVGQVIAANGIAIYPNPFTNQINIQGLATGDMVLVFDAAGRKVYDGTVNNNTDVLLTIDGLTPGIYLLHVQDASGNTKTNVTLRKQ